MPSTTTMMATKTTTTRNICRECEYFRKNRSVWHDRFRPKIMEIGATLAIFQNLSHSKLFGLEPRHVLIGSHGISFLVQNHTAAVDRSDRSIDRPIESIDSIDSIIFRSFESFWKDRLRRDDPFRPKIVKIRAILAIFWPFQDFYLDLGGGGVGLLVITSLG